MRGFCAAVIVTLALGPAPAYAAEACTGFAWPMDREAGLFAAPPAESTASGTTLASFPEGAMRLTLVAQSEAGYPVAPTRAPKKESAQGGWLTLPAPPQPGKLQVTVGGEGWIDVVQSGQALQHAGFAADGACKTMHKSIRFELKAEPVTIQVSDVAGNEMTLTILRAE